MSVRRIFSVVAGLFVVGLSLYTGWKMFYEYLSPGDPLSGAVGAVFTLPIGVWIGAKLID